MIINNLIKNIRSIIGVSSASAGGTKFRVFSDKKSDKTLEDALCETSFLQAEEDSGSSIFEKLTNSFKNFPYILRSSFRYLMGVLGTTKADKSGYSGLPSDVQGVIGQFSSNMDKMPKEISSAISEVSKAFEDSSSIKREVTKEGIKEYVEVFDSEGRKTGSYSVMRYFTGEIDIRYNEFNKNGKLIDGSGVTIHPDDKKLESYTFMTIGKSEPQPFCTYFYSYDGECIGALNSISFS